MPGIPQRDDPSSTLDPSGESGGANQAAGAGDKPIANRALEEPELEAALQLLVERAQYITGATGTALALPQGNEMVCRASAGACAPSIGARLQVRSGLTGESISRRQLLRCDNAETDPRVNIETCRALGIASIVVLPMLRRNGEVRGLFELFSDHPYAFEERDLIALERMADLTLTALDLAEQRHGAIPAAPPPKQPVAKPLQAATATARTAVPVENMPAAAQAVAAAAPAPQIALARAAELSSPVEVAGEKSQAPGIESPAALLSEDDVAEAVAAMVPEAMKRVQKCASCGFPVSEGRTLCLDCEKKEGERGNGAAQGGTQTTGNSSEVSASPEAQENLPAFLANAVPIKESWLSNHVNLLAILVIILGVIVAIVVFR
jgi:putative methionine-R-sulfoxide reductase with GAF domain